LRLAAERQKQTIAAVLPPRYGGPARAEGEVSDTDARLWHPCLRINRVLRVMLHTPWSAEAWSRVKAEFKKAFALRSPLRRAGWLRREDVLLAVSLLSSARWLSVRVSWRVSRSDPESADPGAY